MKKMTRYEFTEKAIPSSVIMENVKSVEIKVPASVRFDGKKSDNKDVFSSLLVSVKYLKDCSVLLREGKYTEAIQELNSHEKTPAYLARTILGRELTDIERPYFFNSCPSHAKTAEIRQVASICSVFRNTHQLLRSKMRELREFDVIPQYELSFLADNIDSLTNYINAAMSTLEIGE